MQRFNHYKFVAKAPNRVIVVLFCKLRLPVDLWLNTRLTYPYFRSSLVVVGNLFKSGPPIFRLWAKYAFIMGTVWGIHTQSFTTRALLTPKFSCPKRSVVSFHGLIPLLCDLCKNSKFLVERPWRMSRFIKVLNYLLVTVQRLLMYREEQRALTRYELM